MTTIDIVFDSAPSHRSPRFIEVENGMGASISVGEWIERGDGRWVLRLPVSDPVKSSAEEPQPPFLTHRTEDMDGNDDDLVSEAFAAGIAWADWKNRQPLVRTTDSIIDRIDEGRI